MKRLISRANHPVCHQVLRYAAAVLLAVLTLFGAVLAVSPEARAAVVGWVRNTFYEFVECSNSGTTTPKANGYHLTYIPDGYELLEVVEKANEIMYLYVDDSGRYLRFFCWAGENASSMFVNTENFHKSMAFVHGIEADVYLANSNGEASIIVWPDVGAGVIYRVHAITHQDELVKIAESVQKE